MSSQPLGSPPVGSPVTPQPHSPSWQKTGEGPSQWVKTQLPKSISTLSSTLSANSEDWKARLHALQEIEKLVLDCKEYERTASSVAAVAFTSTLSSHLLSLGPSLIVQITDLRSEIVRQTAHTLSFLASQLPDIVSDGVTTGAFHKCGVKVLPAVLTVAASSNSVIRGYAMTAAQDIVGQVCSAGVSAPGGGILGHLFSELKHTKNKNVKALAMELLGEQVMRKWPRKIWCGGAEVMSAKSSQAGSVSGISYSLLEEYLTMGLASADTQTRAGAFRAVWNYAKYGNTQRAQAFFRGLEARTRKGILEAKRAGEDDGVVLDLDSTSQAADDSSLPRSNSSGALSSSIRKPTTVSSARGAGGSFGNSSGAHSHQNSRDAGDLSASNLNFSATSISDSILTKALAEARKKLPAAGTTTSGAKRVSAAPAASSSAAVAAKKTSALGLPSRVPTKKPPTTTTTTQGKLGAPARAAAGSSAPASPPHAEAQMQVELMNALEADAIIATRTTLTHQRSISTVTLDHEPGLLDLEFTPASTPPNESVLKPQGSEETDGVLPGAGHADPNNAMPSSVPSSAGHSQAPSGEFVNFSPSAHLKNLSISSSTSEFTPIVTVPVQVATPPPVRATAPGSAGKSPAALAASKRSTSSTVAAQALLSKPASANKVPRAPVSAGKEETTTVSSRVGSATIVRRSLPSSSGAAASAGSASKPTAAGVPVRRSLGATSLGLSRPSSAAATPADEPSTPIKRVGVSSAIRRPASATASSTGTPAVSGTTTPSRTKIHQPGTASPSAIPRPTSAARTPVVKSPSKFAGGQSPGQSNVGVRLALKFTTETATATAPTSSAATPSLTPQSSGSFAPSSNPLSAYGSPIGSSLHSPAGVTAPYSDSTLMIPSGLPSPTSTNSISSNASAIANANIPPELATLLRDHRLHVAESAHHLQSLNSLLTNSTASIAASASASGAGDNSSSTVYIDKMIKLLSDNLAKTTRLLEGFMNVRRKEMAAAAMNQKAATAAANANAAPPAPVAASVTAIPVVTSTVAPTAPVAVEEANSLNGGIHSDPQPSEAVEPAPASPTVTAAAPVAPIPSAFSSSQTSPTASDAVAAKVEVFNLATPEFPQPAAEEAAPAPVEKSVPGGVDGAAVASIENVNEH